MEKTQQIGELVQRREEQKRNLNHLIQKGEKITAAYRVFATSRRRWNADPSTKRLYLAPPEREDGQAAEHLLSREELAQYVIEFKEAERALAETTATLTGLGITL